jgi:HSP20 family protein
MQREIDRLFDDYSPTRGNGGTESAVWSPRVDLAETPDSFVIHVDSPGMKKEDFNLNWQNDTLTISGERKWDQEESKENFVRVERQYGHFFRSFTLPKAARGAEIKASYQDGVLTVTVPKAEESKPRRIEVQ